MIPKQIPVLVGFALASVGVVSAQTGPSIMLTPWQDGRTAEVSVGGFYSGTEANVTGANVDLTIFDAAGRFRLAPVSSYDPTVGINYSHFDVNTADAALPERLIDLSVAVGVRLDDFDLVKSFAGDWQWCATLGAGYAGTSPFNDSDAAYMTANVFGVLSIDRDTRWLVGLNYDGNRMIMPDVPLPAVTYFGRASESLTYGIGFPFSSLTYKPNDRWTASISSAVFFSFTGQVTYAATDELKLFAALVRRNDAFKPSDAIDNRRLLFSQDKAEVGMVYSLTDGVDLTVAGGYAFNQELDFGFDVRDPRGVRDLDDSGYLRVALDFSF